MEKIVLNNEKEFDEYLKKYRLSEKISFKEFEILCNLIIKHLGGNFNIKFSIHKEDLISEDELLILNEKIDKINKNKEDVIKLYSLILSLLNNNADKIKEKLKKVAFN